MKRLKFLLVYYFRLCLLKLTMLSFKITFADKQNDKNFRVVLENQMLRSKKELTFIKIFGKAKPTIKEISILHPVEQSEILVKISPNGVKRNKQLAGIE